MCNSEWEGRGVGWTEHKNMCNLEPDAEWLPMLPRSMCIFSGITHSVCGTDFVLLVCDSASMRVALIHLIKF